ncbi:DUF2179 domain-containing protein [Porphyromonas sp.]|uniref:DUF2179 domain-containing protein n=1 Tax=Porphyromonas sp. TaxID=1924944 RepID=UPI0025801364|nr:DUF2179 domain-containing protein [Porphyromonas sp.]
MRSPLVCVVAVPYSKLQGAIRASHRRVLLVVVRKQQSVAISRIIEEIDPKAFVSNGAVKGVYGEGFESLKKIK